MTSLIDDKLYDLITKTENFEFAFDIRDRFDTVIGRIYKEFWELLQKFLIDENKNYDIKNTSQWEFIFKQKNWKHFTFYFEWKDDDNFNFGFGFYNTIKTKFKEINSKLEDFEFEQDENGLWFQTTFEENFTKLSGLKKILPETRNEIFVKLNSEINEFYKKLEDIIIEYENNKK